MSILSFLWLLFLATNFSLALLTSTVAISFTSRADKRHQSAISHVNATVAQDGTGDYDSISAAIKAAPQKSLSRHVIHVKKGVYHEIIRISGTMYNLTLLGDGIGVTIITGNRSVHDKYAMPDTATVGVDGPGFMLQDLTIQNTAGASKDQAIALRSSSHRSIVYRCSLEGYQDTLYAESQYQFYRDCHISGTVDFIYGYAKAVFQNCLLFARLPDRGQQNIVTAQGRIESTGDSGFVFQFCNITGDPLLHTKAVETYLGRPWTNFARVVFMESFIDGIIRPVGYLPWKGRNNDTVFYGEYKNTGLGSDVSGRVNWSGFHAINAPKEARNFTVRRFIKGQEWLRGTGVKFKLGL